MQVDVANETKVRIACQHGPRAITAKHIIGPFAIHRAHDAPGCWVCTHAATGYSCGRFVHEATAVRAAEVLSPLADWNFNKPSAIDRWPAGLRDRLRGLIRGLQRDEKARNQPRIRLVPAAEDGGR